MKRSILVIIIVIIIVVIVGAVLGYLFFTGAFNHKNRGGFPQQRIFQFNQSQVDATNSFFASNPTQDEIANYCNPNRIYCFNYCRTNPDTDYCKQLNAQMLNYTRGGNYTRNGNYSRRGNYTGGQIPQPPQPTQ